MDYRYTETLYREVKNDVGEENIRRLNSITDPIADDEYLVAMRTGPNDFHFIRKDSNGWYNKTGKKEGMYVSKEYVLGETWYPRWMQNGVIRESRETFYDDKIIYAAIKIGWDKQ